MNLNLFLAAMWAVIGIGLLLPNSGLDLLLQEPAQRQMLGGFALVLSAYNVMRWRLSRLRRQVEEDARPLRPPVRPRREDEPPNPDFDFSDPHGPRPGSG